MLITDEKFFCEVLDTKIPEMRAVSEAYRAGDIPKAEHILAEYVRQNLKPEIFFGISYNKNKGKGSDEEIRTAADRVVDGWVNSCGFAYRFEDGKIDWNSNKTPNNYCEWTWQLSRHPEFYTLAYAYARFHDEKYADRYVDMLLSWIEQAECPENISGFRTLTWRTIEAGIRMLGSWQYAFHTFYRSPAMTDHAMTMFFKSVWEHAYRLRGFCTGFNWLMMEMNGLIHIAVLYPFFADAAEWRAFAVRRLNEQLEVQIYEDGFQFELTTNYHNVVLSNFNGVNDLLSAYGIPMSARMKEQIYKLFMLNIKLSLPDFTLPDLNDGSTQNWLGYGKALEYFPDDPVFRWSATGRKEGHEPPFRSIALPYAGMAVFRTDWTENAMWAFFDGGPFGKAHQHEDKLSFDLYAYGKNLLSDVGCYDYDTSLMRAYVLSTRAHNTGMVDREGQNRRAKYEWHPEDLFVKSDLSWHFTEDFEVAESEYREGYGADFIDVTHRRKVIFFKKGIEGTKPFFVLIDTFSPQDGKEHFYEVLFQLDKQPIEAQGKCVTAKHEDGVSLSLIGTAYPEILIGQYSPRYMGWRKIKAPGTDHEPMPAPAVCFTEYGGEKTLVTVVYPNDEPTLPVRSVRADESGFVIGTSDGKERFFAFDDARFAVGKDFPEFVGQ